MDEQENLNLIENEVSNDDTSPEIDPVEAAAREKGWKPQDEWEGDPADWRDAKTFMDRESFFKKINSQKREIKELQKTLQQLAEHQSKLAKVERENAIRELQSKRKEALQDGDLETVDRLNDHIAEIKAAPDPVPVQTTPTSNPDLEDFLERNPWFTQDSDLREMAEGIAVKYISDKQNNRQTFTATDVYEYVESKMAKVVQKEKRIVADPVASPNTVTRQSNVAPKTKKYTVRDLTDEQKRIGRRFVESGAYSDIQQYVDDLVKTGGLD